MLSLVTDNIPWITERRRMTIEIFHDQIPRKCWARIELTIPVSAIELITDCATVPVILGFLFYLNWPWIYKFSICPIWLLWSHTIWIIDCWAHWPGLSLWSIWGIRRGFGEKEKMEFISGEQRKKGHILRGTETILGNGEYKKTKIEGTQE